MSTPIIAVGDRVHWQERKARWIGAVFLPARIMSGIVFVVDGRLAWVAVEPDGLWHMAELDKLEKVQP